MATNTIIVIVYTIIIIMMIIAALISGYKRAEAKAENDEAAAARYGCFERIFTALFVVVFVALLIVELQDLMTTGFVKIIAVLEELKNG